jgi:hypothetical protein
VELGERAFEIVLARRVAAGKDDQQLVRAAWVDTHHRDSGALARDLSASRGSVALN